MLRTASAALFALASLPARAIDLPSGARSEGGPPREAINTALEWISTGIEVTGVGIMVIGATAATVVFVYGGLVSVGWPAAFRLYRANLGRGILLGLDVDSAGRGFRGRLLFVG